MRSLIRPTSNDPGSSLSTAVCPDRYRPLLCHRRSQRAQSCERDATLADLAAARTSLFTTNFIVSESHALILTRTRRIDIALAFVNDIYESEAIRIVRVTNADERSALVLLNRYTDKRFSLVDASSFAVMSRLGITHAFTFDRNFMQYGLATLP
jgi:uncharacterized protein